MSSFLQLIKIYSPANIAREVYYSYLQPKDHAMAVGEFYDKHHQDFLEVYGELIQAFRTGDIEEILDYELKSIDISPEMKVLDAGCGVGRPALHFAQKSGAQIEAISISQRQVDHAHRLKSKFSTENVSFTKLDYHSIQEHFGNDQFDRVYFLESFGHSTKKRQLLKGVWDVLKPGGEVYIKDLFCRVTDNRKDQKVINREIAKINQQYHYEVSDLTQLLDMVRKIGFVLKLVKTIDIKLESFENLTISNKFQELTGIYKIDSFEGYIFPVDFLEVKLYKPAFNMEEAKDRYFLQNLFHKNIRS
ncbi:SAM-dependent methyltransferase [Marinoscillum sp.]|uniref:SAM-dependent methyltransferase n=1 Tax=Marinoscillum sp. TaxID=2024838 RepID=UPI003BA8E1CD